MAGKRSMVLAAAGIGAGLMMRQVWRKREGLDLFGKVVLITGGARGLGLALAREFAAAGCRLAICAHDAAELESARQDLERHGAHVFAARCDVTNLAEVDGMVGAALERYGSIDILVNCAGDAGTGGPDPEMPLADFEHAMEVMFWGLLYPTRAVLPHMLARWSGRIVNITSWGEPGTARRPLPYDCARSAAVGFSEGLRAELAPRGITVLTVAPGAKASARQIVNATRRGGADRILTGAAQALERVDGLFPGAAAEIAGLVDRLAVSAPNGAATRNGNGVKRGPATWSSLLSALGILGRAAARRYLHAGR